MSSEQANYKLLTRKEAAQQLSICERKLDLLKAAGQLPYVSIGRSVRYDPADVKDFIDRRKLSGPRRTKRQQPPSKTMDA